MESAFVLKMKVHHDNIQREHFGVVCLQKYFFLCLWRTSFHKLSEASFLAASGDVAKQEIQTQKVAYQKKKKRNPKKKNTWKPNKKGIVLQENFTSYGRLQK